MRCRDEVGEKTGSIACSALLKLRISVFVKVERKISEAER